MATEPRPRGPQGKPEADLDALLDQTLARFNDVEPPPAKLAAWAAQRPDPPAASWSLRSWRRLALGFACGVIVAGSVFLTVHRDAFRVPAPLPTVARAVVAPPAPMPLVAAAAAKRADARPAWQPFPLPEPPTEQEKLVARLLAASPREPRPSPPQSSNDAAPVVVADAPPVMFAPVEIRPIEIAPLASPVEAVPEKSVAEGGNDNEL